MRFSFRAEGAGGLGEGVALLGDEFDGLDLKLRGVDTSRSCQEWTSLSRVYTLNWVSTIHEEVHLGAPKVQRVRSS